MGRRCFLTGLLLLASVWLYSQTCIVVYVSHRQIVAGADRLYHETQGAGNHKIYYGKKIFINGQFAWAMSGADYHNSIHTICKQLSANSSSLPVLVNRLRKRMAQTPVNSAMLQLLAASSPQQKERFKANLAELVFFRYEDNKHKAYRVTVSMPGVFNNDARLAFDTDSIVSSRNTVGVFVLGHYEAFGQDTHPEHWKNPVTTIRALIKKQSLSTPDDVSAQSDILRVVGKEFSWEK